MRASLRGGIFRQRAIQGLLLASLLMLPVQAKAIVGIGAAAKAGTTGLGVDLTVPLIPNWVNLRAGYNWGDLRPSTTQGGIKYKGDIHLETVPILLDIHPFNGHFRITGGVFHNRNEMDLSSTVDASTFIGNAPVGSTATVNANISWSKDFAPYLGIGYGNAASADSLDLPVDIGFALDVGFFYQEGPDVVVTESTGTVSAANLAAEAVQIEEDMSEFKLFPVITLGIYLRF